MRIKCVKFTFFILVSCSGAYHPKHQDMVYKRANRAQYYTLVQNDSGILFKVVEHL